MATQSHNSDMSRCNEFAYAFVAAAFSILFCCMAALSLGGCSGGQASRTGTVSSDPQQTESQTTLSSFAIEGKWKNVGDEGFGQAQPGSIVVFDGTNCNFFSPSDTYAFYWDNDHYVLDATSVGFSETLTFPVEIIDEDNITVSYGDTEVSLRRVG